MSREPRQNDRHDLHLKQALRHAPDRDAAPPRELDQAVLHAARIAAAERSRASMNDLVRASTTANTTSDGWFTRIAQSLAAFWRKPALAAPALATVVLGTVVIAMWRGQPVPPAVEESPARVATAPVSVAVPAETATTPSASTTNTPTADDAKRTASISAPSARRSPPDAVLNAKVPPSPASARTRAPQTSAGDESEAARVKPVQPSAVTESVPVPAPTPKSLEGVSSPVVATESIAPAPAVASVASTAQAAVSKPATATEAPSPVMASATADKQAARSPTARLAASLRPPQLQAVLDAAINSASSDASPWRWQARARLDAASTPGTRAAQPFDAQLQRWLAKVERVTRQTWTPSAPAQDLSDAALMVEFWRGDERIGTLAVHDELVVWREANGRVWHLPRSREITDDLQRF